MSITLLTDDDVVKLTGFKQPRKQTEWLRRRGIYFIVNGRGKVVIPWGEKQARREPSLGLVK